jgi:DNA replicative helicase MCM subunit Mcm2 (Cdc46/Mcm family)
MSDLPIVSHRVSLGILVCPSHHNQIVNLTGEIDIKKAIICLLMGGSKKILPDNARLRGDCHVLLLGDPGVAKSQLLKFVQKVRAFPSGFDHC